MAGSVIGVLEVEGRKYDVKIHGWLWVGDQCAVGWLSSLFDAGVDVPAALAKLDELLEFAGYSEWCWKNRVDSVDYFEADAPILSVLPTILTA